MITKALIYGFPFFLILLEWLLRSSLRLETQSLMGNTLASVGLGFVVPLVRPKKRDLRISPELLRKLEQERIVLIPAREKKFIEFIWLCVFIFTACWIYTICLSSTNPISIWWGEVPAYLYLGFASYFIGIILSEVYEKV